MMVVSKCPNVFSFFRKINGLTTRKQSKGQYHNPNHWTTMTMDVFTPFSNALMLDLLLKCRVDIIMYSVVMGLWKRDIVDFLAEKAIPKLSERRQENLLDLQDFVGQQTDKDHNDCRQPDAAIRQDVEDHLEHLKVDWNLSSRIVNGHIKEQIRKPGLGSHCLNHQSEISTSCGCHINVFQ